MSYRNDVDALAARHDALAAEVAAKSRELDSTRQLLDEAKAKARLPVLPNIRVASPCHADWTAMTGDERVRACAQCNKNVYNLSEMTRDEAEALIVSREGRLCVRYYQRTDGTILLKDCSVGITQRRKRRVIAAGAAALLAGGGLFMFLRSRGDDAPSSRISVATEPESLMGVVAVRPETVPQPEVEAMQGQMMVKMGDVAVDPIEDR
ncbi:MAG: hypothetical protein HOV81_36385 [Kofleriaceae bacterium]|nr:hypothetical protein [Kofleriaceae bacterium]